MTMVQSRSANSSEVRQVVTSKIKRSRLLLFWQNLMYRTGFELQSLLRVRSIVVESTLVKDESFSSPVAVEFL